ncbi:uncharacterized protein FIBRA_05310 [Fibroporia radiculosa]|uniref:Uncharacterized protein n=1 Tax=Fibroporia radiculosa TaxID=599839 RepID=J4G924_9APHY|nr:uncharacterized protein FIBRA_05310 [Fibroporia radiculosa]CCM03188.1 predicted protein [Fibroporia radiculosa]
MSRSHDLALRKLCANPETLTRAQVLLHAAILKTGPGSGYNLGTDVVGLPAICAYLASQELNNGDVSEKVAQTASCLAPKFFKSTVKIVQQALATALAQTPGPSGPLVYETLIRDNKLGRKAFVLGCAKDVESTLLASRMLPQEFHPPCDVLRVAVFCWTCNNLLKIRKVRPDVLLNQYGQAKRDYDEIIEIVESTCQEVGEKIRQKVAELSNKVAAASQASSPARSKRTPANSVPGSPTKPALRATIADMSDTTSSNRTPTQKRKVAFVTGHLEEGRELPETPSKRPRIASPAKSTGVPGGKSTHSDLSRVATLRDNIFPEVPVCANVSALDLLCPSDHSSSPASADMDHLVESEGAPSQTSFSVVPPATPSRITPARSPATHVTSQATPRSGRRSPSKVVRIPSPLQDIQSARPKRFRPIFLDQQQWSQADPRIEREWKMAIAKRAELMQNYGRSAHGEVAVRMPIAA